MDLLSKDIKFLAGVGPKRADILAKEVDIYNFEDLIYYFPYKYIDKSKFYRISDINSNLPYIQLKGKFVNFEKTGQSRKQRLSGYFQDESGIIELVWFKGVKWIMESLHIGPEYIIFGKPTAFKGKINIVHPEVEESAKAEKNINASLQPQYSTTEKLKNNFITSKTIHKLTQNIFLSFTSKIAENLPAFMLEKYNLLPLHESLRYIHFPPNIELLRKAEFRLKFEELFWIQLNILRQKANRNDKYKGFIFGNIGEYFNDFYKKNLPFELTNAQKKVLKEIRKDVGSGLQMNRLLQGDVGSGKTLVGLMSILMALDNNHQACLMAPTEILSTQHFHSLSKFTEGLGITIELLTGSTRKKKREQIHEQLLNGELNILVGTHALIEDVVQFKNLGMVIIDEQHRFGVAQRARLWKKNINPPHVLVMTATPIPRTLAMTVYGDLEVSVIDELPPGRKPIKTYHYNDSKRLKLFGFIHKQVAEGRQVYIVYPLIKESEKMDYKDLEDGVESISRAFPAPDYAISVVHGKMKAAEKEKSMQMFKNHQTNIMVATTVIEVGVDVSNATVMIIESAERFGLSQLHQLRGRVGRGGSQSYCILMTRYDLSEDGRKRIETMVQTNDGFEIAEADLKLRGPGDLEGTQQSGIPFDLKIANLAKDSQLLQYARNAAEEILDDDPLLKKQENYLFTKYLQQTNKNKVNWGDIS